MKSLFFCMVMSEGLKSRAVICLKSLAVIGLIHAEIKLTLCKIQTPRIDFYILEGLQMRLHYVSLKCFSVQPGATARVGHATPVLSHGLVHPRRPRAALLAVKEASERVLYNAK